MALQAMPFQGKLVQAMVVEAIPHQGGKTKFRDLIIIVLLVVIAKLVFS
jgi:hypothetical protein